VFATTHSSINFYSSNANLLGKHPAVSIHHTNDRLFLQRKQKWVRNNDKQHKISKVTRGWKRRFLRTATSETKEFNIYSSTVN